MKRKFIIEVEGPKISLQALDLTIANKELCLAERTVYVENFKEVSIEYGKKISYLLKGFFNHHISLLPVFEKWDKEDIGE